MAKVIVVDDDPRYYEPLIDRALNEYDIELVVKDNWEEAQNHLDDHFEEYDAIILDGKGKVDSDSKGNDPRHLKIALENLNVLKGKGQYIPRYINTAYYDDLNAIFGDEPMFSKNSEEEKLFQEILDEVSKNDINKIKTRYPDVFECFGDNYLSSVDENRLLEVLLSIENKTWDPESLVKLRKVIENIYLFLHDTDEDIIPFSCVNYEHRRVNFEYCSRALKGMEIRRNGELIYKPDSRIVPEHLGWLVQPLDKVCSISSAHDYKDLEHVNIYTIQTVTFGVMEFLIWMKNYVDENYE